MLLFGDVAAVVLEWVLDVFHILRALLEAFTRCVYLLCVAFLFTIADCSSMCYVLRIVLLPTWAGA